MSWRKEEKEVLGIKQGLKKEMGVTGKLRFWLCYSHNNALYFLGQYFQGTTLTGKNIQCLYISCELKIHPPWSWAGAAYLKEDVKEKCEA